MSSSEKDTESVRPCGRCAHTNIEPCALGRSQPMASRPSQRGVAALLVEQALALDGVARARERSDRGVLLGV